MRRVVLLAAIFFSQLLIAAEVSEIESQINKLNETLWVKEIQAQKYEATFIRLWDELRPTEDKYLILKNFKFDSISIPTAGKPAQLAHGVVANQWQTENKTYTFVEWLKLLDSLKEQGFILVETEWHQPKFEIDENKNARSYFNVLLHITRPSKEERYVVKGEIKVDWNSEKDQNGNFLVKNIEAKSLTVLSRTGTPAYAAPINWDSGALEKGPDGVNPGSSPEPLIVYDLDKDGLSDIALPGWNLLYKNLGNAKFEMQELVPKLKQAQMGALIADFTGDGLPDLICAPQNSPFVLHEGIPGGKFKEAPRKIEAFMTPLKSALCLCAGDIDNDGALDLWVTQYK
jgi:hypothetical protein